jgi:phage terminase large subunit-like protein
MAAINVDLHDAQAEIFLSEARYKVVAAGRRFGKSYLSAICLLIEALKDKNEEGRSLADKRVFYVAPTFDQGKRIIWDLLMDLGKEVIDSVVQNQGIITLNNGRRIEIKGADRPDTLRGVGLSYLVMDEYAFMKPEVWEQILRPTLTDVKGHALFIGTPDGKNHFYDLFVKCADTEDWEAFTYTSFSNPTLDKKEIEAATKEMSSSNFKQEYEASFSAGGGTIFKEEYFQYLDMAPGEGYTFVAVDPAGFAELETKTTSNATNLDECAIAIVKCGNWGWFIEDIEHGRWGAATTAAKILRAAQKHNAMAIGIEKGSLKNAIMPYLKDRMMKIGFFPKIKELTHGNQKKTERIAWALEGRFEHGRIYFKEDADYVRPLESQLLDFPNPLSHDDLVDAVAYIDQMHTTSYDYDEDDDPDDPWVDLEMGRNDTTGY